MLQILNGTGKGAIADVLIEFPPTQLSSIRFAGNLQGKVAQVK